MRKSVTTRTITVFAVSKTPILVLFLSVSLEGFSRLSCKRRRHFDLRVVRGLQAGSLGQLSCGTLKTFAWVE